MNSAKRGRERGKKREKEREKESLRERVISVAEIAGSDIIGN